MKTRLFYNDLLYQYLNFIKTISFGINFYILITIRNYKKSVLYLLKPYSTYTVMELPRIPRSEK